MLFIFESMGIRGHEEVFFCQDKDTGLRAIIAIHNTTIGPALGGCRMWNYNSDEDALKDVLRLSRGMSYKAAIAGLNLGYGMYDNDNGSEETTMGVGTSMGLSLIHI